MQGLGLQPDVLVLRTDRELGRGVLDKVGHFCNVEKDCVVQSVDLPTIYEVPVKMAEQHLDAVILRKFGITCDTALQLGDWQEFINLRLRASREINIALSGNMIYRMPINRYWSVCHKLRLTMTAR